MRKKLFLIFGFLTLLASCVKDAYKMYVNNYYIRVPLLDNNQAYLNPKDSANRIAISKAAKLQWKFEQQADNIFILKSAANPLLALTDSGGYAVTQNLVAPASQNQLFRLIPALKNERLISLQAASGNYLTVEYCVFNNDSVRYMIQMEAAKMCSAYTLDSLRVADTCYCVQQFELQ